MLRLMRRMDTIADRQVSPKPCIMSRLMCRMDSPT